MRRSEPGRGLPGRNPPELGAPEKVIETVLGCRPEEMAEDVVLTPFIPLKAFRRHVEEGGLELAPPFFFKGFTAAFRGRRVTVILTGVGPSRVGDCVSLLALTPARRVLFAGAVGGLRPDQAIGDFFLPLSAADGEGYSRYRRKPFAEIVAGAEEVPCAGGLEEQLLAFLSAKGVKAREGRVFTVGAIAVESRANLQHLADAGYDALEMELSAFYSAAAHHGLQAAALAYVSDLPLVSSLWQAKSPAEGEALRAAYRALPVCALEFLASLGGA